VLVALTIISVALLSALRVAGQGTTNIGELRSRLLAGWVAGRSPGGASRSLALVASWHAARHDARGGLDFAWQEK
jgi:hypothetical protein